jgi:hypothetical protein
MQNRTITLLDIFAADAQTTIPEFLTPGVSYRNIALDAPTIRQGWEFQTKVLSENFNEIMWVVTMLQKQLETQGLLSWCATVTYVEGAICFGSDASIYVSLQNGNINNDPTNPANSAWWNGIFQYIESQISTLQGDITTIDGEIATLQGDVSTIDGEIATIDGEIATIDGEIATIDGEITTIDGEITTIDNEIAALKFGEWVSKSDNTVYHALTDGFVCAVGSTGGNMVEIWTDGNSPPQTKRVGVAYPDAGNTTGVSCPVRKGDYWKTVNADVNVFWLPWGS